MKMLTLSLSLLFSLNLFSSECFKDICVNDYVRDSFGWGGQVVQIQDEGVLRVALFHAPDYIYSFQYDEMGKLVECHKGFCLGQRVLDPYQNAGVIEEIYTNDLVFLSYPDSEDDNQRYKYLVELVTPLL